MKKNQTGFTIVEALLAVIALSLIGFIGFYVYHANQKTNESNSVQSKAADAAVTTKTDTNKAASSKKLIIKELGISLDLTSATQDVKYMTKQTSDHKSVTLTSSSYAKLDEACKNGGVSFFGGLIRHEGIYDENTSEPLIYEEIAKQFKDFYITYSTPDGGACLNGDAAATAAVSAKNKELKAGVIESVKSATVL